MSILYHSSVQGIEDGDSSKVSRLPQWHRLRVTTLQVDLDRPVHRPPNNSQRKRQERNTTIPQHVTPFYRVEGDNLWKFLEEHLAPRPLGSRRRRLPARTRPVHSPRADLEAGEQRPPQRDTLARERWQSPWYCSLRPSLQDLGVRKESHR